MFLELCNHENLNVWHGFRCLPHPPPRSFASLIPPCFPFGCLPLEMVLPRFLKRLPKEDPTMSGLKGKAGDGSRTLWVLWAFLGGGLLCFRDLWVLVALAAETSLRRGVRGRIA